MKYLLGYTGVNRPVWLDEEKGKILTLDLGTPANITPWQEDNICVELARNGNFKAVAERYWQLYGGANWQHYKDGISIPS